MKLCSGCKVEKPLARFSRNRSKADGLQDRCKDCNRADYLARRATEIVRLRKRYAENRDAMLAQQRAHYAANREAIRERENARIARDPEASRSRVRAWRRANPERYLQQGRDRYWANPQASQEAGRRWREENAERKRETDRKWREANPGKRRESSWRYLNRKRGKYIEHVSRLGVFERDGGICQICGERVDVVDFHVDHVIPLSKGGTHEWANVQLAHPRCNRRKSAKLAYPPSPGPIRASVTRFHDRPDGSLPGPTFT